MIYYISFFLYKGLLKARFSLSLALLLRLRREVLLAVGRLAPLALEAAVARELRDGPSVVLVILLRDPLVVAEVDVALLPDVVRDDHALAALVHHLNY